MHTIDSLLLSNCCNSTREFMHDSYPPFWWVGVVHHAMRSVFWNPPIVGYIPSKFVLDSLVSPKLCMLDFANLLAIFSLHPPPLVPEVKPLRPPVIPLSLTEELYTYRERERETYICPKTGGGGGVIHGFDGFLPVLAFFPLLRVS